MQDIVFYAAANETLGVVRDCTNMLRADAPVLTIGVAVCLKMRLFSAVEVATPYPLSAFTGVANWQWSMDSDFNRNTASKLVADEDGISVHTVTDTVNGETRNFTEFVIPISNMNTQELSAWLGAEKTRSGLTGELVGYDSSENAAFVLQVENFTVRNRVAGLADPTALDQGTVTRTQVERMIQSAVSSSAATKQDKLNLANAGTGISVTSAGIISVSDVPQSAVAGLETSLAGKQNTLTAGYRTAIVNGSTVDQARYFAIESAITAPANQTTSVVLSAGRAYEIHAVAPNAKVLLNREEPVGGTHTFGLEGHAEIFVANTGYIQTGEHVVLSEPLKPDSVNNCTVRFHDNMAIISVEDHIAGYVVTFAAGSTAGTLPYALSSATQEYVAFDASLNGSSFDMAGAVTNGEKHVVGNGYTDTILTGGVTCTSKTTFANLAMNGVVNSGGTMTLGDVYLPSGATVSVSGGRLAVEKIVGDGGVINLGGTNIPISSGGTGYVSGCVFTGGYASQTAGVFSVNKGTLSVFDCVFSGNSAGYGGDVLLTNNAASVMLSGCTISDNVTSYGTFNLNNGVVNLNQCVFSGNTASNGGAVAYIGGGTVSASGCVLPDGTVGFSLRLVNTVAVTVLDNCEVGTIQIDSGGVILTNSNAVKRIFGASGSVTISSGATVNITSGISAGGGITIPAGAVVTILGSGGSSAYISELALTGATITNTPAVLGATVTVPTTGGPWDVHFADDTSSVYTAGETERQEVLSGAVVYIGEQ